MWQFNLIVHFTVSPEGSVLVGRDQINSALGDVVELTCTAEGGPSNSFSWTFLGQNVGSSPAINVSITSVLAGGDYTCAVRNEAGDDNATTLITGM